MLLLQAGLRMCSTFKILTQALKTHMELCCTSGNLTPTFKRPSGACMRCPGPPQQTCSDKPSTSALQVSKTGLHSVCLPQQSWVRTVGQCVGTTVYGTTFHGTALYGTTVHGTTLHGSTGFGAPSTFRHFVHPLLCGLWQPAVALTSAYWAACITQLLLLKSTHTKHPF